MMKKTIINYLLLGLLCMAATGYANNYDSRCFIAQFSEGATQAEIDALLNPYNLTIEDGPTKNFNSQFALVCVDQVLGFPGFPVNNNGEVDINGVIITVAAVDEDNDNIFDAIGLNYGIELLPQPSGDPFPFYRHPLAGCNLGGSLSNGSDAFSINTVLGNKKVKVGLLDTGVKFDYDSQLVNFFNPNYLGWNIIEDTPDPTDDNGHGTHMASSLALATPSGFSSVLKLKAYKTHDIIGSASIWNLIEAIDKAIEANVQIINMSNSYKAPYDHRFSDAPLKAAIQEAMDLNGILFVTAAGNNGTDNDDPLGISNYPASFPNNNILAVAAVNCDYMIPDWANYGAFSVDIAAPGVGIWGLNQNGDYIQFDGSSSAAALTSRVAAMLATQQNTFDYAAIKCAIINGANQEGTFDGQIETLSKGYLDAEMAQSVFDTEFPCSSSPLSPGLSLGLYNNNALNASIQNGRSLNIDSDQEQMAHLRVFNILGQVLYSKEIVLQKGQNNHTLEIPEQPFVATYICHLQYGTQSKTIKFVK